MIEDQFLEPEHLNQFVTAAYTSSVENNEYLRILSELPQQHDSQDIFLKSLTYDELSEQTIFYIITSLCTIFNHNKSIICNYFNIFTDFFLNTFVNYPKTPAILNSLSKLFVIIFKSKRELAINVIKKINDDFLRGILSSYYIASTNSMSGLSKSFKIVLYSFSEQARSDKWESKLETHQNIVLFSKMLSSFNNENIPSKLIDLINQIGGPKMLLNSVLLIENENESIEFLKSLEKIINLPIEAFKTNPNRLKYLMEFIEGTIELIGIQTNGNILFQLSFLTIELRNCPSIRSLKNADFLNTWLENIFHITINCLSSVFLESCPVCIENWMHFWSLTFDFQCFHENSEFKGFALNLIDNVIGAVIPFLIENSSKICECFICGDCSSNFFEFLSKICHHQYSMITAMICESKETDKIEEIMWHIEFSNKLINFHSNFADLLNFIDDDLKMMEEFKRISSNISFNLNPEFEYLLISCYQSFLYCYGKKQTKTYLNFFKENKSLFIFYIKRIIDNLSLSNLPLKSIRLFVRLFDFKLYPESIIDEIIETPEIIQKVVDIEFPFCYEKDKKIETNEFYGYFFTLLQSSTFHLNKILESLLSKMNSIDLIPFVLNIYGLLFQLLEKNIEFVYSNYFNSFYPVISELIKMEDGSQNMIVYHHLAKVLSMIANSNEFKHHFKFMSENILNLFKSSLNLLIVLLKNSNCDDKILHFSLCCVNSFIKNEALNIGIMVSYNDFSFNQFLSDFLSLLSSKEEIFNQKFLFDLINLFDLIANNFDVCEQPYFDSFFYFLNEIIIKGINSFPKKAIIKTIPILSRSFNFLTFLKESNDDVLKNLLLALLNVLPVIKNGDFDSYIFYLNLFILEKNVIIEIIESLESCFSDESKFTCLMENLTELLNSQLLNNRIFSNNRDEYRKIIEYIKESIIIRKSQPQE